MAALFFLIKIRHLDQNGKMVMTTDGEKDQAKLFEKGIPHLNWATINKFVASYNCFISQATCKAITPWINKKNPEIQYLSNLVARNFTSNGSVPKTSVIVEDIKTIFKDHLNESENCLIISDKQIIKKLLTKTEYKHFNIKHLDVIKITLEKENELTIEKVEKHADLAA